MNLRLTQIKNITMGAVRIEEKEDGIHFHRFTKEQEELYKERNSDLYMKTFATSGVRLQFRTDSGTLFLKAEMARGSTRSYFAFDVFVNGERIDSLDNFSHMELAKSYAKIPFTMGEFSKEFCLGAGQKDVCVYFPWSTGVVLKELKLDDDSVIEPIKLDKKILCFGDSITQGYDALHPSNKYITQLADMLGAEEHNKAIGKETFFPELAATREDFTPDYITVAYGSNDWNRCTREEFCQNCEGFFKNLTTTYPNVKTFVITPIWRKDYKEQRACGEFEDVGEIIKGFAEQYENITVISGFNLVEHNEDIFADLRLHPRDEGFAQYFKNLAKQIPG